MGKYILALDQGTTSSRAILFDSEQNILAIRQHELTQHYPHEGWVEQDPMEIWSTQYAAMLEVLAAADVSPADVAGIGITNQRETTILWDKNTGRPIHNAIVWQCRRTGVHRLSGERPSDRHETRYRHCPLLPFCGRRCQPRQLPDAVPERYFGLHDSPSGHPRNDRARRMLSCRTRDRCVAQPRRAEAALAVRYAVCALDGRE